MRNLSREDMMEAIRQGVEDGIWRIATNNTLTPCQDFYDTIKQGVEDGVARLSKEGIIPKCASE
jgi:hypothetical protein